VLGSGGASPTWKKRKIGIGVRRATIQRKEDRIGNGEPRATKVGVGGKKKINFDPRLWCAEGGGPVVRGRPAVHGDDGLPQYKGGSIVCRKKVLRYPRARQERWAVCGENSVFGPTLFHLGTPWEGGFNRDQGKNKRPFCNKRPLSGERTLDREQKCPANGGKVSGEKEERALL